MEGWGEENLFKARFVALSREKECKDVVGPPWEEGRKGAAGWWQRVKLKQR